VSQNSVAAAKSRAHHPEYDKWNPEYGQINHKYPYNIVLQRSGEKSTDLKFLDNKLISYIGELINPDLVFNTN
jgi:hypothetical protein